MTPLTGEPTLSRTDSTDPHWVRATWWEPRHWRCVRAPWLATDRPCDLPAEPVVSANRPRFINRGSCIWIPSWDNCLGNGVPHWFNRVYFTRPERARVRDQLCRARAEYRGTGEVDVICEAAQHRHQGRWLYW